MFGQTFPHRPTPWPPPEPFYVWVYVPIEKVDFRILMHDVLCSRSDEIYGRKRPDRTSDQNLIGVYWRADERSCWHTVTWHREVDVPMSTFQASEEPNSIPANILFYSDMLSQTLGQLRGHYILAGYINVNEPIDMLQQDSRGYSVTRPMTQAEHVAHFERLVRYVRKQNGSCEVPGL